METGLDVPSHEHLLPVKKEPKEEYFSDECGAEPLRSLVLRFVRSKNGNYSVVPLIKPDPFFEEELSDFCSEDGQPMVKVEQHDEYDMTFYEIDDVATKQENIEEDGSNSALLKGGRNEKKNLDVINTDTSPNSNIAHCSKCIYTNNIEKVRRHMQRVHPTRTLPCRFCDKANFKEPLSLEIHILATHWEVEDAMALITRKIFSCDYCKYRTLKRSNYKRHLTRHGDMADQTWRRLLQQQDSGGLNASKNEIKMALKKTPYNCYHCPYNTRDKGSIIKHVRLHKSTNHMPFLCPVCARKFNEKNSLDLHIVKRHVDDRELLESVTNRIYECELCDYKDVNKSKVERHKRARHVKKQKTNKRS